MNKIDEEYNRILLMLRIYGNTISIEDPKIYEKRLHDDGFELVRIVKIPRITFGKYVSGEHYVIEGVEI